VLPHQRHKEQCDVWRKNDRLNFKKNWKIGQFRLIAAELVSVVSRSGNYSINKTHQSPIAEATASAVGDYGRPKILYGNL